jgi:hypothetical protein
MPADKHKLLIIIEMSLKWAPALLTNRAGKA